LSNKALDRFTGYRKPRISLNTRPLPLVEIPLPPLLSFSLIRGDGEPLSPLVKEGDFVEPGKGLATDSLGNILPCTIKGKVISITQYPDLRGARKGKAILVSTEETGPSDGAEAVQELKPLDPEQEPKAVLMDRVRAAGLLSNSLKPQPLLDLLIPSSGKAIDCLIISAMDREPEQCSSLALFMERKEDVASAVALMGKISGAKRCCLARSGQSSGRSRGAVSTVLTRFITCSSHLHTWCTPSRSPQRKVQSSS
jgi:Na+-translocating ferredoxin:NAD+ oxidoreductase RnfC subunit